MALAVLSETELDLWTKVKTLFKHAKRARQARVGTWNANYKIVNNQAWSQFRESWMPSPSVSEIYPIIAALVGWMTDQRPSFTAIPWADPHSQFFEQISQMADDLETALRSAWIHNNFDAEIERLLWDAMLYGTGFLKVVWDAALADGQGDVGLKRVDPFTLYPDPGATSFYDANYIIEVRNISAQELYRRFPDAKTIEDEDLFVDQIDLRDQLYQDSKAARGNPAGINGVATRYGRPGAARESTADVDRDDVVTVYECWIRDSNEWTDKQGEEHVDDEWRVVIAAGRRIVLDEKAEDLFGHGRHPYIRYQLHDLGDMWGISLVEHLAPMQRAMNRLLAALQSNAELIGNPVLMEDSRSGIPRTKITNKPGQRLTKNAGSEVGWLTPPDMPQGVTQLVQFYIGEMERVSGLSAIVRGATPTGRNSQGVMDSVQESSFVRVRLALRNLERSLQEAAELCSSLIVENYTMPRMIAVVGPDEGANVTQLGSRHFFVSTGEGEDAQEPMRFSMSVQAGSAMPISRTARAAEADTMFAMGAIDQQALLEAHEYPGRRQILERINALKAAGMFEPPSARQRR